MDPGVGGVLIACGPMLTSGPLRDPVDWPPGCRRTAEGDAEGRLLPCANPAGSQVINFKWESYDKMLQKCQFRLPFENNSGSQTSVVTFTNIETLCVPKIQFHF